MTYVKYALILLLAIVLIIVALANASMVTLRLLPQGMAGFLGWSWSVTLPLFLVILGGIMIGVLVGFVWEWLREHKHRAAARHARRDREELEREVSTLRADPRRNDDDVVALLDARPVAAVR